VSYYRRCSRAFIAPIVFSVAGLPRRPLRCRRRRRHRHRRLQAGRRRIHTHTHTHTHISSSSSRSSSSRAGHAGWEESCQGRGVEVGRRLGEKQGKRCAVCRRLLVELSSPSRASLRFSSSLRRLERTISPGAWLTHDRVNVCVLCCYVGKACAFVTRTHTHAHTRTHTRTRTHTVGVKSVDPTFIVDLEADGAHTLVRLQVEPHLVRQADDQVRDEAPR